MTRLNKILCLTLCAVALLLLPLRAAAQSGTVTDDGFISTNSTTQQLNLNGQGISLIVAGSSATVGSTSVGTTKVFCAVVWPGGGIRVAQNNRQTVIAGADNHDFGV